MEELQENITSEEPAMKKNKIMPPCETCHKEISKYTCPKCAAKTCSINCVKQHKDDLNCDGMRPARSPTWYPVNSISAYDNHHLSEDHEFLKTLQTLKSQVPRVPKSINRAKKIRKKSANTAGKFVNNNQNKDYSGYQQLPGDDNAHYNNLSTTKQSDQQAQQFQGPSMQKPINQDEKIKNSDNTTRKFANNNQNKGFYGGYQPYARQPYYNQNYGASQMPWNSAAHYKPSMAKQFDQQTRHPQVPRMQRPMKHQNKGFYGGYQTYATQPHYNQNYGAAQTAWNTAVHYNKQSMTQQSDQQAQQPQVSQDPIMQKQMPMKNTGKNISNPLLKFVSGYDSP